MFNLTPFKISCTIALTSSLTSFIIFCTFNNFNFNLLWIYILGTLIIFIITFFVSKILINNFLYKKINPLYKIISTINFSKEKFIDDIEDKDIVKEIKKDIILWAKKKSLEINQLKQLEKYRREFIGNISHELKTPVFNIQGYTSTLLDGAYEDRELLKQYLQRIDKNVNRLVSIINDLESISKLESGELKLNFEKFDIIELIEESFEINERMANEKNIKLKFNKKYSKPLYVFADKHKILEVLNNLINNSIKYGKNNGNTIVSIIDMNDKIMVEITDNGIGIEEQYISRIFERFFRIDKSRSRELGGTGLGLAIVKHIIEAHQQNIYVKSQPGVGSTFSFTLNKP